MPGRGLGERLAVDPNNPDVIYFGARSGNGLWKSTDAGLSFAKVSSFTNVGTYVPDATDTTGYNNDIIGIAWVTFDDSDGTVNGVTKRIFVGVADVNESVFVSVDGGTSWAAVAGQPTGSLPHKGKIAPDGNLYITYANGAGPVSLSIGFMELLPLTLNSTMAAMARSTSTHCLQASGRISRPCRAAICTSALEVWLSTC